MQTLRSVETVAGLESSRPLPALQPHGKRWPPGPRLLLLELNELNFEFIAHYARAGKLPTFKALMDAHGHCQTTSEIQPKNVEPWIQWVTAHTGLTLAEHKVFRLGDMMQTDIPQIWESLEQKGLKVGAMCPINAKARLESPAFFVPDPWTTSSIVTPSSMATLHAAISRLVNDNAENRIDPASAIELTLGVLKTAPAANYARYMSYVARSISEPWFRALFLDQLLSDLFVLCVQRTRPHFASFFLNGAAHIQHHYMFSAAAYRGASRNPSWYIKPGRDPLLDAYRCYDGIVARLQKAFPATRLMIATGLHQDPSDELLYYWRLRDHADFLTRAGVPFLRVEPRMSRDFLVVCEDVDQTRVAERLLKSARDSGGMPLFEVSNRGTDLFVMLAYPYDIPSPMPYVVGNQGFSDLRAAVVFVALKNGQHNGVGYFIDTATSAPDGTQDFPLHDMPQRIIRALTDE